MHLSERAATWARPINYVALVTSAPMFQDIPHGALAHANVHGHMHACHAMPCMIANAQQHRRVRADAWMHHERMNTQNCDAHT